MHVYKFILRMIIHEKFYIKRKHQSLIPDVVASFSFVSNSFNGIMYVTTIVQKIQEVLLKKNSVLTVRE